MPSQKTLEEPPEGAIIILIGTSQQRQLPTIRSRCQTIRFNPLSNDEVRELLESQSLLEDDMDANEIASLSGGSLVTALHMTDGGVREFRESWLMQLATFDPARENFGKEFGSFVDSAGKEASLRRERTRMVADWAIMFYRELMYTAIDPNREFDDPIIEKAARTAQSRFELNAEKNFSLCGSMC